MRIAMIGGGSFMWTFGLVRQFVQAAPLKEAQVCLMDIDAAALDLVGRACSLLNSRQGKPMQIVTTTETDEALTGADFVIVSISTGGLDAMRHDLAIPAEYGIYHTVGDTVGPGGWARAVRNIPVFYDLAERMSRLCSDAWLINVTNPLSVLTRVPHKCFGIKSIGMCPGLESTVKALSRLAGAAPDSRRDYVATGIDHGSFITALYADGMDVLAELKRRGYCRSDGKLPGELAVDDPVAKMASLRAAFALWREIGYMSGINDRHMVENYPWFLYSDSDGCVQYGVKRTSIEERFQWREDQRRRLEQFISNPEASSLDAVGHGDDPIGLLIEALTGRRTFMFGSNYRNVGQIPDVPRDAVVETRCFFDRTGVHPDVSPMPDVVKALVLPTIWRQEAVIDIALRGTFDELVSLVLSDPLCARLELRDCRQMMRKLLVANQQYIRNPALLS